MSADVIILANVRKAREIARLRARLQHIDPLTLPFDLLVTWFMINAKIARYMQDGMQQ